jgi:hypothetical protein
LLRESLAFSCPAINAEAESSGEYQGMRGRLEFFKAGRGIWRNGGGTLAIIGIAGKVEAN